MSEEQVLENIEETVSENTSTTEEQIVERKYKYAEIYGGKVRDLKESHMEFVDFCSIWEPTAFWLDVTGVEEIGIGWVIKADTIRGTYFEKPKELTSEITLETRKNAKLEELNKSFKDVQETAYVISSLGFRANAGERAYRDVDGLITQMEEEAVEYVNFRDYDNIFQPINLEEAKVLKLEIIKNGQSIYLQKWNYENEINSAETEEELNNIHIYFDMVDFFTLMDEKNV